MPTSDHHNINTILTVFTQLKPNSILDIGCGFGKYGVLLREYLDVWQERLTPAEWKISLIGIEAFQKYHNPIHDFVYNRVHFGEAESILPTLGSFDAILIADVIEHLEKTEAVNLIQECFRHSPVLVISTPIAFYPQEALCQNPYEIHRNHWTRTDFPREIVAHSIRLVSCDIFVASRDKLNPSIFALTDPVDLIYLRSRKKLGKWGWPISTGLRWLCQMLS